MPEPVVSSAPAPISDILISKEFCLQTRYTALETPGAARAELDRQLRQSFGEKVTYADALSQLLVELGPIFWKGVAPGHMPKYEVWLVHGHYDLKPDENMVSRRDGSYHDIMQPMILATKNEALRVAVERWDYDGHALEHRILNDNETSVPPPPKELWDGFRRVMNARSRAADPNIPGDNGVPGITGLGVTVTPWAVAPQDSYCMTLSRNSRFLERTGAEVEWAGRARGDRKHVTTFEDTQEWEMVQITWLPIDPSASTIIWLASTTRTPMALSLPNPNTTDDPEPDSASKSTSSSLNKDNMLLSCCTHGCTADSHSESDKEPA